LISFDLEYKPSKWVELTGTMLHGQNFANLGGIPTGITIAGAAVRPVRGAAGWLQLAFPVTNRLTFDLYAGRQLNRAVDLSAYEVETTLAYAGNALYRIAPNVIVGFEAAQDRIKYLNGSLYKTNRYDLTAAYLF
jgi:hypothetical protein